MKEHTDTHTNTHREKRIKLAIIAKQLPPNRFCNQDLAFLVWPTGRHPDWGLKPAPPPVYQPLVHAKSVGPILGGRKVGCQSFTVLVHRHRTSMSLRHELQTSHFDDVMIVHCCTAALLLLTSPLLLPLLLLLPNYSC